MKRIMLIAVALFVCLGAWAQTGGENISPTKYDYSQAARQITAGCNSKYDQAKAIYRWLCDNISYDTSFTIYTADECWEKRRGVCQAYSELFCRLAEAIGLKSMLVGGWAKTTNEETPETHAWVFAIVEEPETGILMDPTWGAGSMDGSTFKRNDNDNSWFDVNPYWMIFTHFPNNETFQFIDRHITLEQFRALPCVTPLWGEYGFSAREIYERCTEGRTDLPQVYKSAVGKLKIAQMPMSGTLRVGEKYIFAVQKTEPCELAIIDSKFHENWQQQENVYVTEYMPTAAGSVHLAFKQSIDSMFATVVEYAVAPPTKADLLRLEAENPLLMPEITGMKNFDADDFKKYGIDGRKLLAAVRRGEVTSLPIFYDTDSKCTAHDIPLNGTLRAGQSYTFTITPQNDWQWAVVNGENFYREWQTDPATGRMSITITPTTIGEMGLLAKPAGSNQYEFCIGYDVQ